MAQWLGRSSSVENLWRYPMNRILVAGIAGMAMLVIRRVYIARMPSWSPMWRRRTVVQLGFSTLRRSSYSARSLLWSVDQWRDRCGGGGLLARLVCVGRNSCCGEPAPACCEPAPTCCEPAPTCCEPAPTCCEPAPAPVSCCAPVATCSAPVSSCGGCRAPVSSCGGCSAPAVSSCGGCVYLAFPMLAVA